MWAAVPNPSGEGEDDLCSDADTLLCAACHASHTIENSSLVFCASCSAMTDKPPGVPFRCFCGSESYRYDQPAGLPEPQLDLRQARLSSQEDPVPRPVPYRRRRGKGWLWVAAGIAAVVFGWQAVKPGPLPSPCPRGSHVDAVQVTCVDHRGDFAAWPDWSK